MAPVVSPALQNASNNATLDIVPADRAIRDIHTGAADLRFDGLLVRSLLLDGVCQ